MFAKNLATKPKMRRYCFLNSRASLGLLFWGIYKTALLESSIIIIFGPVLTVLAGYLALKDKITKIEKIRIVVTFLGSFVIIVEPLIQNNINSGNFLGNLLVFGYVIFAAIS